MQLFVDISSGTLVQGIGANSPANPITIKSQDTLDVDIYLLLGGVVQDEGESPVLKFGLVAASDVTTMLVLESTFTRQVDPVNGVYYSALAVFNTTEMVAALAATSPLPAILEIRFQLADGEIIHTLDQLVTVDRTILLESGTTSPVGIESYPDASTLLVTGMKDQPSGVAALSSAGFLNPADFDPSVVVLQSQRNVASGFGGLDAGALLLPAQIPIDGVTIISAAGKLSSIGPALAIVSVTTQAFTTPTLGGTVEIEAPVAQLVVGAYYLMSGVGLYQYTSPIDATHGTYTQIPAPASATPGTSVASGQSMQTSGPPGPQGVAGPTGATGPASTVPGPTGPASTVPGPTGPTGPASTVPGPTGPTGPMGAGLTIKGTVATSSALPSTGNTTGDLWIALDTGIGWAWSGTAWVSTGPIQGPTGAMGPTSTTPGPTGPVGPTGPSGGVTSIVAGTNVTISPTDGLGAVTINASGGSGTLPLTSKNIYIQTPIAWSDATNSYVIEYYAPAAYTLVGIHARFGAISAATNVFIFKNGTFQFSFACSASADATAGTLTTAIAIGDKLEMRFGSMDGSQLAFSASFIIQP